MTNDTKVKLIRWKAVAAYTGIFTKDRRLIEDGALIFRAPPIPLMWHDKENDTHGYGAMIVGAVESAWMDGYTLKLEGTLATNWAGIRVAKLIEKRQLWPEIDLDQFEAHEDPYAGWMIVTKGRLQAVTLGERPVWGNLWVELVEENND